MKIQDSSFLANTVDEQIEGFIGSQNQQRFSPSLNGRIVQDLSQVYGNASYTCQLERSLEHIWQRLEAHGAQATSEDVDEHQSNDDRVMPGLQQRGDWQTQKIDYPIRAVHLTRQKFVARLSSLVAVLLVALLVSSLVLTLLATHYNGGNAEKPSRLSVVTVHIDSDSFHQTSVTLQQGMTLSLVNDTAVVHVIENGYWKDNSAFVMLREPGMPTSPVVFQSKHEVHRIGPLNNPGAFHLFDAIHVAMNLLITVQQSNAHVNGSPTPVGITVVGPGNFHPAVKIIIHLGTSFLLINKTPDKLVIKSGPGMPTVDIVIQPGQQRRVGPFNMVGTYYLVDTAHAGMNLTIVVQ